MASAKNPGCQYGNDKCDENSKRDQDFAHLFYIVDHGADVAMIWDLSSEQRDLDQVVPTRSARSRDVRFSQHDNEK